MITHRGDLLLLQNAEHLRLQRQRKLADLVEEERASVCASEAPDARRSGPGEGPFDVSEELALDEVLRDRGAVHRDEGALGAGAGVVKGACHELLARSALARDQDRAVGVTHALDDPEDPHQGRVVAQYPGRIASPPLGDPTGIVVGHRRRAERGIFDGSIEGLEGEGLQQEIRGVVFDRPDRVIDVVVAGHDHHRQVLRALCRAGGDVETVTVGQVDVGQDEVDGWGISKLLGGFLQRGGQLHVVPRTSEVAAHRFSHRGVVVDDQDALRHGHGTLNELVERAATFLCALTARRRP